MTSILDTKSPLLWRACLAGEVAIMDKVMDTGVDPHKMDRNGESCLHMSARSGEVDAVERMVQVGLNLNQPNHNGQTPLHVAVSKGHTNVVRFIVRRGGNTDLQSKFSGMTALHLACVENDGDIVQFLLENGANCAMQDTISKYADNYTQDDLILTAFDSHFPECTHGRRQQKVTRKKTMRDKSEVDAILAEATKVPQPPEVKEMEEDSEEVESPKMKRKEKKRRSKREKGELNDREGVEIYDKMEHYDVDRARENWDKARKEGKKIKINHSLGFSKEHKQRMSQNVFDRLMKGGGKGKE